MRKRTDLQIISIFKKPKQARTAAAELGVSVVTVLNRLKEIQCPYVVDQKRIGVEIYYVVRLDTEPSQFGYMDFARAMKRRGVEFIPEYKFHPTRKWRFDFANIEKHIAVEVEGGVWIRGRHTRGQGYIADMEKYNEAALLGWRVIRATPQQVRSRAFQLFILKFF